MFYGTLKKIEKAGGKLGDGNTTSATLASTPVPTTPKKARGKKRKTTPVEEEDDEEATPIIKKQRRKMEAGKSGSKCTCSPQPIP